MKLHRDGVSTTFRSLSSFFASSAICLFVSSESVAAMMRKADLMSPHSYGLGHG